MSHFLPNLLLLPLPPPPPSSQDSGLLMNHHNKVFRQKEALSPCLPLSNSLPLYSNRSSRTQSLSIYTQLTQLHHVLKAPLQKQTSFSKVNFPGTSSLYIYLYCVFKCFLKLREKKNNPFKKIFDDIYCAATFRRLYHTENETRQIKVQMALQQEISLRDVSTYCCKDDKEDIPEDALQPLSHRRFPCSLFNGLSPTDQKM